MVGRDGGVFLDSRQVFYVISYHSSCCTDLEYGFFFPGKTSVEGSREGLFVSPGGVKSRGG